MNANRAARRIVGFVVHNWPLKLAAIVLATLLYAGLVASQGTNTIPGPITVVDQNRPPDTIITNQLRDVDSIRYYAAPGAQRPRQGDFRATVDLTNVRPDGKPVSVPVRVTALDPNISIIGVTPATIQVVLERSATKDVQVTVVRGPAPDGIDVGEPTVSPQTVSVRGPASAVARVVRAQASVALDPTGIDVNREVEAIPIDENGDQVTGVDVEPATVRVQIQLLTNKESRTLPVNPVIAGVPAPGFRITAVAVTPLAVTVEGEAEQLASLVTVDTAPISVAGATATVAQSVALAPPQGITVTGSGTVRVTVTIDAITETRTFTAGLRLDGTNPNLDYRLNVDSVLITLFGSIADLDRLSAGSLVVGLNVADLEPGTHEVSVVPDVGSGVDVVELNPRTVVVTVSEPAASESPGASAPTAPSASPGGSSVPTQAP